MAITFVAKGGASTVSAGNNSVAMPAGIQQGDLLILIVEYDHTNNIAAPSGWTPRVNQSNGLTSTDGEHLIVYTKIAGAAEGNVSVPFPTSATHTTCIVEAFRGVNQTSPIDVVNTAAFDNSGGTSLAVGAITPTVNYSMIVFICSCNLNAGTQSVTTAKTYTGYTNQGILALSSGSDTGSIAGAYGIKDVAALIGSPSATYNYTIAANAITVALALRIADNEAIVAAGAVGAKTASGAVAVKNTATLSKSVGTKTSTGAATVGAYVTGAGTVGAVTGSGDGVINNTVNASGAVGAVSGSGSATLGNVATVSGTVGTASVSGALVVYNALTGSGVVGAFSGSGAVTQTTELTATGTVGHVTGNSVAETYNEGAASGAVGSFELTGAVELTNEVTGSGFVGLATSEIVVEIADAESVNTALASAIVGARTGSIIVGNGVTVNADIFGLGALTGSGEVDIIPGNFAVSSGAVGSVYSSGDVYDILRLYLPTDDDFVLTVEAVDRTFAVAAVDRTITVPAVDRIITR